MKLSVVITAQGDQQTLHRCLDSIESLPERAEIEVIVVRVDSGESLAHARARGIQDTCGDVIVILGERYRVTNNWARVILEAHESECGVIGGCVTHLASSRIDGWSIFLWEYIHIAPPMASGRLEGPEAVMLPGGNTSYKRKALGALDMAAFRWELDYHAALFAKGIRFCREAEMLVTYEPPPLRQFIAERFWLSYDLAAANAADLGVARKLVAGATRIILPLWLVGKMVVRTLMKKRYGLRMILSFPLLVFFSLIQTAGELAGYCSSHHKR